MKVADVIDVQMIGVLDHPEPPGSGRSVRSVRPRTTLVHPPEETMSRDGSAMNTTHVPVPCPRCDQGAVTIDGYGYRCSWCGGAGTILESVASTSVPDPHKGTRRDPTPEPGRVHRGKFQDQLADAA